MNLAGTPRQLPCPYQTIFFMENQNLMQKKSTITSASSEALSNLQMPCVISAEVSRKNRILQEKLKSSNKIVKRNKRREGCWKTKCQNWTQNVTQQKKTINILLMKTASWQLLTENDYQWTSNCLEIEWWSDRSSHLTADARVIHLFDKKEKALTPELNLYANSLLKHDVPS